MRAATSPARKPTKRAASRCADMQAADASCLEEGRGAAGARRRVELVIVCLDGRRPTRGPSDVAAAQIVEDDMGPEAGKPVRRSATADRLPEALGQPGVSGRAEAPPKSVTATAAKVLMPALKELASGLGTQHELVKEMLAAVQVSPPPALGACSAMHTAPMALSAALHGCHSWRACLAEGVAQVEALWLQDSERGRQSSLTTLLAEVSERGQPKPSREEADRLKRDVSSLAVFLSLSIMMPTCACWWLPLSHIDGLET